MHQHIDLMVNHLQIEDDRRILGTFCEHTSSIPPIFARTEFLYVISLSISDFPIYFNASFVLVDGKFIKNILTS